MTRRSIAPIVFVALMAPVVSLGQMHTMTREQMLKYTAKNPYERFPDGRPMVPDSVLALFKDMSAEELLPIVRRGYPNQYADGLDTGR